MKPLRGCGGGTRNISAKVRWNNLELEIFFAQHAEFMMSAAA
jgi:hypothetical protein